MTTVAEFGDIMKSLGARDERMKQRRKVVPRGKVLSLMRANGEWVAVVQAFRSRPGEPVLSRIVPVAELKGSARRKADRWVESLK